MADLKEIMAAKQREREAEEKARADKLAGAVEEMVAKGNAGTIALGMQGSQEQVKVVIPPDEVVDKSQPNQELAAGAKAVFRALDLRKYWLPGGEMKVPINGFYYAQTDEEVVELQHHERQWKVEEVKTEEQK